MEKETIQKEYYRLLGDICNISKPEEEQSFMLFDTQAWQWGVELYKFFLLDYCASFSLNKLNFATKISLTNKMDSKVEQAKRVLEAFGNKDEKEEKEEGWWLREFMRQLDQKSSKQQNKDKRNFTRSEYPLFLEQVVKLANAVAFTPILLGLALLRTQRMADKDKRLEEILRILPTVAAEYFRTKGP